MRDTQADVPSAKASGATCVQRLDGSRDSAIHTKYRISLRSSSMREPRYPLPRVVMDTIKEGVAFDMRTVSGASRASTPIDASLAQSAPGFVVKPSERETPSALSPTGMGNRKAAPRVMERVRGSFCLGRFRQ